MALRSKRPSGVKKFSTLRPFKLSWAKVCPSAAWRSTEKESPFFKEVDPLTAHVPIANTIVKTKNNLLTVSSGSY
jgi:hypothetical protein